MKHLRRVVEKTNGRPTAKNSNLAGQKMGAGQFEQIESKAVVPSGQFSRILC
jgi:hypothetical protein